MQDEDAVALQIGERQVRITHPGKLYFSEAVQVTKMDLVRYYLAVAPGALAGVRNRPFVLKRFVHGAGQEPFFQKRAPGDRPAWLRTATLSFPSGRTAEEVVLEDAAGLAWVVNLGCMELHPHPVRADDLEHPDELRIDLDPGPGVDWAAVRLVALEVKAVLEENGLTGWPKTSGSRGIHVYAPILPRWSFSDVRRAALALAREVERRVPALASSKWWKEERHGVFLDYNQNAKDRTTCSAYSVRPLPDARVSAPLDWQEVPDCDPAAFTILTMPARYAAIGDPHQAMDAVRQSPQASLEALLELAARDEASGLGDAPWPPHFRKGDQEPSRVAPSRAKRTAAKTPPGARPDPQVDRKSELETSLEPGLEAGLEPGEAGADIAASATRKTTRARRATHPLLVIAKSPDRNAALAGLARWKERHSEAAALLKEDDVLIDRMRGASSLWTRIRVNLRNVPEPQRPLEEAPDPDDDPTQGVSGRGSGRSG